ncbi:hypothetical protein B0H17DRAFT_1148807 [Mycena rosella]|uniref:Uncharacterized protein n=1 Tax=Mycena rosella TaxID=1033263 RepID=A0AAD7C954_MYCRO|nr:hypothetical protein B0H17DRAFT_1148807 [Mycena rosella]
MAQSKGRNYASMDGPHVHTLSCSETSKLCWYELELCMHPQLLRNAEIMTVYIGLCTELRNAETMISSAPKHRNYVPMNYASICFTGPVTYCPQELSRSSSNFRLISAEITKLWTT